MTAPDDLRRRALDALFERARAVRLLDVPGLDVSTLRARRGGTAYSGPCPACGGGKGSTKFTISVPRRAWYCFAAGVGGGVIELVRHMRPVRAIEAAELLAGVTLDDLMRQLATDGAAPVVRQAPASRPALPPARTARWWLPHAQRPDNLSTHLADALWREAARARGTLVEAWLLSRGLDLGVLPVALDVLRFHPCAPAVWDRRARRWSQVAPAMVAPIIRAVAGAADWTVWRRVGVHVTYLSADGRARARLYDPETGEALPARKILGAVEGGLVPLSRLSALAVDAPGAPLVMGEGIETVWGGVQHLELPPARVAAALSLGNLQGQPLRDRDGAFDPRAPMLDPARAPVTIPDAGDVVVLVDADMAPVTVRARRPGSRVTVDVRLGALERAELCAALAGQAWRRAGARSVRTPRPPLGMDFNDLVREEVA